MTTRRDVLKLLGAAAAAPLVACARRAAGTMASTGDVAASGGAAVRPLGIQLYTLRSAMQRDPDATLAAVAAIGYREVELAGLYGRTPAEFRRMLDAHGLTAPSSHVPLADLSASMPRVLDDAATLGNQWIVCPWMEEKDRTPEGFRRVGDVLNSAAQAARGRGMRVAYHNHDFEFKPQPDGQLPYDVLLASTDPALVKMEIDLFWITNGGHDPLAYFAKWPGRFPLVHVKDRTPAGTMVDVGQGAIDFKRIFAADPAIEHFFVEHDEPKDPIADARVSYEALRKLVGG